VGLFNRSGGANVVVTPEVARPRQTVTATVTTDKPLDEVGAVRLEWGYDNFYRYHEVGANYGGECETDDWVCVDRVEIPVLASEFAGTSASFKVPSWAPGSSPALARWGCRLVVARGGRDVDTRGDFAVVIGAADVDAVTEPMERIWGDGATVIDIELPSPVYRAGETISGQVVLRPQQDLPNGDVAVYWQRLREHHPLGRHPAQDGTLDGRTIELDKEIPLRAGAEVILPFALPLPTDAAPSGEAVHSSVSWFVAARMSYSGFTGHQIERVRRPIVVVNAP
jgi:hypothetical protein